MKTYLKLLRYLIPYKSIVVLSIIFMVGFALTNGAFAYMIGPVIKYLFTTGSSDPINLVPFEIVSVSKEQMMLALPIALLILALVKGVCSFGQTYFMGSAGHRVVNDVRSNLYRRILDMPVSYFTETPTGVLSSRLTHDVDLVRAMTTDTIVRIIKHFLTMVVLAAIIIGMDWKLALASSVAFPLAVYPMSKFGRKMKKTSKATQLTMGSLTTLLQEAIVGVRIVKAFCMEGYEEARFRAENERFTGHHLKALKIRAMASPIMEVFGAVGFAATIYYASYRINAGTLDPANFVSFFAATIMLYQPIKALNGVQLNLQQGLAAADRVFDLLDMPPEEEVLGGDKVLGSIDKSVEFKDVSFGYGEKTVLDHVNFFSNKGEITAFVGLSGSGKSTLVNLIPRFYDVQGGAVLIDGRDIKEIKVSSLRSQIAIVSQEIVLFNDTVRNNIAYGDTVKSDEVIRRAAEAANAEGFIAAMPDGYDTVIGEGGIKLSGGERQRLSIARAILKDAPILIMDEATSSLDTASEMEVQKGLDNLMAGRTAFVIAHRLSTVRGADNIVVLRGGRVVEIGTHADLLKGGGEYARLHAMQFYEDEAKVGA